MTDASFTIAIVSTLISSLALVGVMVSLLAQVRQLQVNRLQAFRATQAELIKMALDDPALFADPADALAADSESSRRHGFLNWHMKHFQLGYVLVRLVRPECAPRRRFFSLFPPDAIGGNLHAAITKWRQGRSANAISSK
nr:DUF6082 family protein [Phytohabitans aurantiacus]